jgi:hypothetical protein
LLNPLSLQPVLLQLLLCGLLLLISWHPSLLLL